MTLPPTGRLLAVDVGHVRVGLAICDAGRVVASPLENYTRRGDAQDALFFQKLAKAERVVGLVVGLPIMLDGSEQTQANGSRAYGAWLANATGLPCDFHDERFTSSLADDVLLAAGLTKKQRKARRDMLAARLILQGYLEAHPPA